MVAGLAPFFCGPAHSLGSWRFPPHLLLLSRRRLQIVLGRSTGMHSRRTEEKIPRRKVLPFDHAECASVLSLRRNSVCWFSCLGRLESHVVHRSSHRQPTLRPRPRHFHPGSECCASGRIHLRLSFFAPPDWRCARSNFQVAIASAGLFVLKLP